MFSLENGQSIVCSFIYWYSEINLVDVMKSAISIYINVYLNFVE